MWSNSGDGRRYRLLQSGCPGRKEGGRLMGKASRGEWGLGSRCPPPSSFWLEFCGFSEETPERFWKGSRRILKVSRATWGDKMYRCILNNYSSTYIPADTCPIPSLPSPDQALIPEGLPCSRCYWELLSRNSLQDQLAYVPRKQPVSLPGRYTSCNTSLLPSTRRSPPPPVPLWTLPLGHPHAAWMQTHHVAAPVTWWQRLPWVLSDEVEFGGSFLNWCQQGPSALVFRAWGNFCPQRASSCSLFFCCSFWHSRLPFVLDLGGRWASRALGADIGGLVSVLWLPWPGWLLSLSCPPWVIWIFSSASLRGEPPRASARITGCFLLDWRPVKLSVLEPGYLGRTLRWSTSAALSHHTQVVICMVETSRSLLTISPPFKYLFCPPPLEEFLDQLVTPGCCLWGSVGHLLSLRALHKYPLSR